MDCHVHLEPEKADAFGPQLHALFEAKLAGAQNFATGAHDTLPRQVTMLLVQRPGHLQRRARIAAKIAGRVSSVA